MHDVLFRSILGGLTLVTFCAQVLYGKRLSRMNTIGDAREPGLMIAACLWTCSLGAYTLGFAWHGEALPLLSGVRWIGAVFMTLSIPLSMWVYRSLGVHFSARLELRDDHHLVQSGPYRIVRHPMYTTFMFCALGAGLLSANLLVMTTGFATALMMVRRIKEEEAMLAGRFGVRYEAYRTATGALLPKFKTLALYRAT